MSTRRSRTNHADIPSRTEILEHILNVDEKPTGRLGSPDLRDIMPMVTGSRLIDSLRV